MAGMSDAAVAAADEYDRGAHQRQRGPCLRHADAPGGEARQILQRPRAATNGPAYSPGQTWVRCACTRRR